MSGLGNQAKIKNLTEIALQYRSTDPKLSLLILSEAKNQMKLSGSNYYEAFLLNTLGVVYGNLGISDSSFYFFKKAKEVSFRENDSVQMGYSLNNLGEYYFRSGLVSIALENIYASYRIFEALNHPRGIAYTLNDLGELYTASGDYQKALKYLQRAEKIRLEISDKSGYAKTLINIATVHEKQNMFDTAKAIFEKAFKVSAEANFIKGKSEIDAGRATIYFKEGKYYEALERRKQSLKLDLQIRSKRGEIINYNEIGLIYFKLGDIDTASRYFYKALDESEKSGYRELLLTAYSNLITLAINKKDYFLAYQLQKKYSDLKKKIYNEETLHTLEDIQTIYELESKNNEFLLLKKSSELEHTTNKYLMLVLLLVLIVVVISFYKYRSWKKLSNELKELNKSKDKFFSIIAHDLKSPFHGLLAFSKILVDDYEKLSENERKEIIINLNKITESSYKLIDNLLEWSRIQTKRIEFVPEVFNVKDALNSTLKLASEIAKNKSIVIETDIDNVTQIYADKNMFLTIIRNLLSNAVKFSHLNSKVTLDAIAKTKFVEFSIQDNGVGIDEEQLKVIFDIEHSGSTSGTLNEKGTGLGLLLCKEMVEIHKCKIWIESKKNIGSTFYFTMPIDN